MVIYININNYSRVCTKNILSFSLITCIYTLNGLQTRRKCLLDISICIIYVFSGKIVPSKYLWVGNIPTNIKRRDFEHAFSRYGQIQTLDYSTGDPIAIITYIDIEDAIKARSKLNGTIQIIDGRVIRDESDTSPSSRHGKNKNKD